MKGKYIILDGVSGSGKDTQMERLEAWLKRKGVDYIAVHEPFEKYMKDVLEERFLNKTAKPPAPELATAHMFVVDRVFGVTYDILPALKAGRHMVSDRSFVSSLAYQSAGGVPLKKLLAMNDFVPRPDLVLIYDVPVEVLEERVRKRGGPAHKYEKDVERMRKVRSAFLKLPGVLDNVKVLDATKTIEELEAETIAAVRETLGLAG